MGREVYGELEDGGNYSRASPPFAIICYAAARGGRGRGWRPWLTAAQGGLGPATVPLVPCTLYLVRKSIDVVVHAVALVHTP